MEPDLWVSLEKENGLPPVRFHVHRVTLRMAGCTPKHGSEKEPKHTQPARTGLASAVLPQRQLRGAGQW